MQAQLRYWDYYGMSDTFDRLYKGSKNGESFDRLYDVITSRENILLAYRTIKTNKGSKTAGVDGRTIDDFKGFTEEEMVDFIRKRLSNYQPMKVRRVFIPKPNGDKRPLGIPSMSDRIIQQAFKQVLEPICEARFYNHSYGFRPLRSTHHAVARVNHLITHNKLHYVVDIDIKGFFDNVNHTLLIKQLWNMGIRDRKVLRIISKMLKAEIDKEGVPTKGTPQGGILSPLLSNVVLNDLDQWVASQWESFPSRTSYCSKSAMFRFLRKGRLKEGFIVRYADDFKILCKDWKSAQKWYHAVKLYLKDRLKLDISPEKSQVVNLRKRESEFLGFSIKAVVKGNKRVTNSHISKKKKEKYVAEGRERIKKLKNSPTAKNAQLFNSWVLGIHSYSRIATHVSIDFNEIAHRLAHTLRKRLRNRGKFGKPKNPSPTYERYYKKTYNTFEISGVHLYPIGDIKNFWAANFNPKLIPYDSEGRKLIYRKLKDELMAEIRKLMESNIPNRSVEYFDNRISRYSMKNGKCEITGEFLPAELVHCHHYVPISLGGTDTFGNLRILNKFVHKLIHAKNTQTIDKYRRLINPDKKQLRRINTYREKCNLEPIR